MIYDAHCHMDLMENMPAFINEIKNSNVSIFAVGTTPKAYDRETHFCRNAQNIYVGLGMHPQLISSGYDDWKLFADLIEGSHYIGEVGLDFSREYVHTRELQVKRFGEIIKLCEEYGKKVVSIHALKSVNTVIDILKMYKKQNSNRYIFHWFTGTIPQLEKAIELGCYFSINPKMLKTKSGIEVVKRVPIDHMLLESDAPFALKIQRIGEIEKELKRTLLMISDVVGFDVSATIYENSKYVFSTPQ